MTKRMIVVRGRWALLAAVGVLAALGAVPGTHVALLGPGGDSSGATSTAQTPTEEFKELMQRRAGESYHAVYKVLTKSGGATGQTFETWQDAGRFRIDAVRGAERTANLTLSDRTAICRGGSGAWACDSYPKGSISPDYEVKLSQTEDVLAATDGTWNGTATRCFSFKPASATQKMCLLSSGIPVSTIYDRVQWQATSVDANVSEGTFSVPPTA